MSESKDFSALVEFFDQLSRTSLHQKLMQEFLQFILSFRLGSDGIEIGSASGCLAYCLCQKNYDILATDPLESMLQQGHVSYPHPKLSRQKMRAEDLNRSSDFVYGSLVFHLLPDPAFFLRKIQPLTKRIFFLTQSLQLDKAKARLWCEQMNLSGIEKEFIHGMTNSGLENQRHDEKSLADLLEPNGFTNLISKRCGFEDSILLFTAIPSSKILS